jgi:hypothetical protein
VKLGVALIFSTFLVACSSSNTQYATSLETCILRARADVDAGTYEARLAEYNKCADAIDAGVGK